MAEAQHSFTWPWSTKSKIPTNVMIATVAHSANTICPGVEIPHRFAQDVVHSLIDFHNPFVVVVVVFKILRKTYFS